MFRFCLQGLESAGMTEGRSHHLRRTPLSLEAERLQQHRRGAGSGRAMLGTLGRYT